jgi:hypothetical protein
MSFASHRGVGLAALVAVLGMLAAACGGAAGASSDGASSAFRIASPANGATVSEPFTVRIDAGVTLGDPSTGEHHVHLCFDGDSCDSEYTLVYGSSIPVTGLAPGEHTIRASLRNADHSDAGPADSITVTVTGASPGAGASATPSQGGGHGYGY